MNKKSGVKGGIILSFCLVFLLTLLSAIFGIVGVDTSGYVYADNAAVANVDDGSNDVAPSDPGDGTAARPFILWGDTENKAMIWAKAITQSGVSGKTVNVKLASNWIASESDLFTTSFAGNTDTNPDTTYRGNPFIAGAINVAESTDIVLDLNGYNLDRNLSGNPGHTRGYVIAVDYYSRLEIKDSTAHYDSDGEYISGWVTGGYGTSYSGGVMMEGFSTFVLTSGAIRKNHGNRGAIELYSSGTFTMNGGEICYNECVVSGAILCGYNSSGHSTVMNLNGGSIHHNTSSGSASAITAYYGKITINDIDLYKNESVKVGAIWARSNATANGNSAEIIINGGKFHNNESGGNGGILYISYPQNNAVINGGEFYENTTKGSGGIVEVEYGSSLIINGGNFYGNSIATGKSGMIVNVGSNSNLEINGGKFHDNVMTDGAAVTGLIRVNSGTFKLTGGEFYSNGGEDGGYYNGILHLTGYCTLTGGFIYGNGGGNAVYINTATTSLQGVYIGGDLCVGYKREADGSLTEIPNYEKTAVKGEDGYYVGTTRDCFYFRATVIKISFISEFTGKLDVGGYQGIITNGWGVYNSGKDVNEHFYPITSTYEITTSGTGASEEVLLKSKTNTLLYASAPTWDDGNIYNERYFTIAGSPVTVPVSICAGSEITSITRTAGTAESQLTVADIAKYNEKTGLTEITASAPGKYVVTASLQDGYYWNNTSDRTDRTLTFYVREEVETPEWADGTTANKSFVYTGSSISVSYSALPSVSASCANATVSNGVVSATAAGLYSVTFSLDATQYIWADGTTDNKTLNFYIRKPVTTPDFTDGGTIAYKTLSDGSVTFTAYSEGVGTPTVSGTGATVSGNKVSFTQSGTYTITFTLSNTNSYVWTDNTIATKTLTLYVKDYVDSPKWSDGTTDVKFLDATGSSQTFSFVRPEGTIVTLTKGNGEPETVTGSSVTVSEAGAYVITFTLPDGDAAKYMWKDGSTALTKTLSFYIAKIVQTPTWDDGSTGTKYFEYTGEALHILNIPAEGVTVKSNYFGPVISDGKITCEIAGTFTLTFSLQEGYVWRGNTVADISLTFSIRKSIPAPTWGDGTPYSSQKFNAYTGYEQEITILKTAEVYATSLAILLPDGITHNSSIPFGATTHSLNIGDLTLSVEISDTTIVIRATQPARYRILLDASSSCNWAGTTTAATSCVMYWSINGKTQVAVPMFDDGSTSKTVEFGNSVNLYAVPEGVKISVSGNNGLGAGTAAATINGTTITALDAGTYTITFALTDSNEYGWADGTLVSKTLTFYVVKYLDYPVWTDGTTAANKTVKLSDAKPVSLTVPEGVTVSCSNPNAIISTNGTTVTLQASAVGTYTLTFALPNTAQYRWTGTTSSANVTRTLYITGSTEVESPTFADGTTAANVYDFTGYSESNPFSYIVTLPAHATISQVRNTDGINGIFKDNGDGTATITVFAPGYYNVDYVIDTENYVWADGTVAATKTLLSRIRYLIAAPVWSDNTSTVKYVTYSASGNTLSFIIPENVAVSCTDGDAVVIGNSIYATEPGVYTVRFNIINDKANYQWIGSLTYQETTLTFYITGGTKVEVPEWADGTTAAKYLTAGSASISTYKLPEGVELAYVSSTSTAATYSVSGGVATINASAVGTYTVYFRIDPSKYVWADNSVSEYKTLTFYVTAKTIVNYPTWADGTTEDKYYVHPDTEFELYLNYASTVNVTVVGSDSSFGTLTVNGNTVTVPEIAYGKYTFTFTLKDPANYCWANGTTAPRTFSVTLTYVPVLIPEWEEGGTQQKYLDYSESGNTVSILYAFDHPYYFTYIDENGINRGMMEQKGDVWSLTYNGKTVTVKFVEGAILSDGNTQRVDIIATAPGTYIFTHYIGDQYAGDLWEDFTETPKTLTFTINPENITKVSLPEWDNAFGGGSDELYFTYTGERQVVSVKDGENYVISSVTAPATFSGNEIYFTGVGVYTVTLSLVNAKGYCWEGGEGGTKTLTFYVTGATEVEVPTWSDGTTAAKGFTYSASGASVTIAALGDGAEIVSYSAGLSKSGNTFSATGSATASTTYTITFGLTDATKYKWADGTVGNKTLSFTIIAGNRTIIAIPDDATATYTGSTITFTDLSSIASYIDIVSVTKDGKTYTENVSPTSLSFREVGVYVLTLGFKTATGGTGASYVWSNGSTANIQWTVTVQKAEFDVSTLKLSVYNGAYDGANHPATVSGLPSWITAKFTYTDASGKPVTEIKNAGEYTVSVTFTHSNASYKPVTDTLSGTIVIEKAVLSVKWTGNSEYNYNNGSSVALKADVFGVVDGEGIPYEILLDGLTANAGKVIGNYTAIVRLKADAANYTFAGDASQVTFDYSIKNLSTVITDVKVTLSVAQSTLITVKNTDALDIIKPYITKVTVTYDNGYSEEVTAYTLSGDFGAANPYFAVCYGGAQSESFAVKVLVVADLDAIRVEEVENITTATTVAELKALLEVTASFSNGDESKLDGAAITLYENGVALADNATLAEGKHTITVSYTHNNITKTDAVTVTVEGVKLVSVSASLADGTKIYSTTTDAEIKAALTVTATYSDGSTATVGDYTVSHGTFVAGGAYTLTITYNNSTDTISGTVEADVITSITAEWKGGSQDKSGMPPVYAYSNLDDLRNYITVKANGTEEVTGYLLAGDFVADSECVITVTYANCSDTIKVNVLATPSTVTFKEVRVNVNQGNTVIYTSTSVESLKSLLTVEEVYLDGSEEIVKVITEYTISGTLTAGTSVLAVSYESGAKSASFNVKVTAVELETITVEWIGGTQPTVYNTQSADDLKSLIAVYGTNNNGTAYNGGNAIADYTLSGELNSGKAEITVTVAGKSATFTVNVTAVVLTDITVSWADGAQGNYKIYTSTNPAELKNHLIVKAIYSDSAEGVVLSASEYEITASFVLGNANNPIYVAFNGVTKSFNVKVEGSELSGIVASYSQSGTVYSSDELNDLLTKGTLTVTAKFSGGAQDEILGADAYTLSGDLTKGACIITVTYNGKTATFTVNVTEVALIGISAAFDKDAAGSVFTTTDIQTLKQFVTVTANYGNGSDKSVTAESFTLSGNLADGYLTVEYEGKSATFEITAVSVAADSVSASYAGGSVYATAGLDELRKNLTVTVTYNDKSIAEVTDYELSGKLTAGKTCTITVTYNGKTATFDVTVEELALTSVAVSWKATQPTVYTYTDVETLRNYLNVVATLSDNSTKTVADYEITGDLTSPKATITITYGGRTDTIEVTVTAPDSSVEMQLSAVFAQGNVRIYEGASLDVLEGYLTVTATYGSNSKTVQPGAYTFKAGSALTVGECEITVVYDGKEATFTVTVSAVELVEISAQFTQQGEVRDSAKLENLSGLTVTAVYTDGSVVQLGASDYALSGDLVAGTDSVVTVTYLGKTATFTVTVAATPVTFTISASFDAAKFGNVYTSTSVEDLRSALTVTATYTDANVKVISGYTFVTTTLASGNITVKVSYLGEEATFSVNVLEVEIESIIASFNQGANKVYTSTDIATLAKYLTVTGVNNDGSSFGNIALVAGSYTLTGELKAGKCIVTLTIVSGNGAGKSATFEVDVTGLKVVSLDVSFDADGNKIFSTMSLDELRQYFTVKAVYNDNSERTLGAEDYALSGVLAAGVGSVITVSYNGATQTYTVNVEEKELSRIEVTYVQSGVLYSNNTLGDVTANGTLGVTAYYTDDTSEIITEGYALSGSLTSGNCLVTVTYGGKSDTFEVTVSAITLLNITARLDADAPEFFTSTTLSAVEKYITVTAHYSDGSSKELTSGEYTLTGTLTAGTSKLTVSYDGKTANVSIGVTAVKLEGIAAEAENLPAIFANTSLDDIHEYVTVLATYTDGKIVGVTSFTMSGNLVAGETCTLTVSYGGLDTTLDVRVEAKELSSIAASYNGGTVSASTALDELDITVTVSYTDGTSAIITEGFVLSGTLTAGNASCAITVTYGDKSDVVYVSVDNSVTLEKITATLGNAEIYTSTSLTNLKSALTVEEVYSNGSTKTVAASGYTLAGDLSKAGECTVTVTLTSDPSKTCGITLTVLAVELDSISAQFDAENAGEILITATLDSLKQYLTVTGLNNDGTKIVPITAYTLSGDIAEGECEITVSYGGKTATFKITVSNKDESGNEITLKEITATVALPAGVEIYPDAAAEDVREYVTVYAIYTTSAGDVTKQITGFGFASATLKEVGGKYYVTVSFGGKTAEAEVSVTEVALAQISADFRQQGAIYTSGSLSELKQYLTVSGINNDGTAYTGTISANDYTLSGELSAGKCEITVNYQGLTATFEVTVTAVTITEIQVTPDGDNMPAVYTTTDLDTLKQYLTVKALYNDGSEPKTLIAADYTLSGELVAGKTCTITVSYNGKTGSFDVKVASSVLTAITAEYNKDGNAPEVFSSTELDSLKDYLTVKAMFGAGDPVQLGSTEYTLSGDLTSGVCTVTVSYNGKTATFKVTVTKVELVTLNAQFDKDGNAPEIYSTTSLESLRSYITLTAGYSDGNSKEITGYTFADVTLHEGENTITVNYGEKSATFTVTVTGVKLDGISAEFDKDGAPKIYADTGVETLRQWLTVRASYTDGKLATVYDYSLTLKASFEAGKTCTVTVSYGGKTATFDVTIEKKTLASITATYSGAATVDNTATLDDLAAFVTVTAYYDDTTEENVTGFTLSGTLAAGTVTVTVNYSGKTDSFTVTVKSTYTLSKITATFAQGNTRIYENTKVDTLKGMLSVYAHFVDENGYAVSAKLLDDGDYTLSDTLATGRVTVSYRGLEATFTVDVTAIELDSLTAVFNAGTNKITAATQLNDLKNYLTVTGVNNDGSKYNNGDPIPASRLNISGDLIAGQVCTLTVTVDNVSATFEVSVASEPEFSRITAVFDQSRLNGTVYTSSDISILVAGLTVTAHYTDGTTRVITYPNYSIVCDLVNNGGKSATITVTYNNSSVSATGTVSVTKVEIQSITASFNQNGEPLYTSTTLQELIDMLASGKVSLSVVGVNNDGSFAGALGDGEYALTNLSSTGEVTVEYVGNSSITASFNVILIRNDLNYISVAYNNDAVLFESGSTDKLKDYLTVKAYYTGAGIVELVPDDYRLTFAEISRDADKVGYTVTVDFFGKSEVIPYTVYVYFVKLDSVNIALDPAYKNSNIVIYDSMSAADAAALVENYLTITGYYNDSSDDILSLGAFIASGQLSVLVNNEATITLAYATDANVTGSFKVEVTKVAFSNLQINFNQPVAAKVYASQTIVDVTSMLLTYELELDATAFFNNGTSRALNVADLVITADASEFNADGVTLKEGQRTIKVTYTHGGVSDTKTFTLRVDAVGISRLTATLNGKTVYTTTTLTEFYNDILTVTAVLNNGDVINPDSTQYTTDLAATQPFKDAYVNSYDVTVTITYGGQTYELSFKVAKAIVTIDTTGIGDYTYGDNEISGLQTVEGGAKLLLNGVEVTDTSVQIAYSNNTFATYSDLVGGKITITISFAGDDVYAAESVTFDVTVNKAAADFTGAGFELDGNAFGGGNITYDDSAHTLEFTSPLPTGIDYISTSVYEYTQHGASSAMVVSGSDVKNAGTYVLTVTFKYNENYTGVATMSTTLVIDKAQAVIDISNMQLTFTYTGAEQKATGAVLSVGDATEQPICYTVGTVVSNDGFAFTHVSDGNGVTVIVSVADGTNYLGQSIPVVIVVNKASLTITANDHSIVYGDQPANNGVTESGLVNGETFVGLGVTFSYTYDYIGSNGLIGDVGDYEIAVSAQGGNLDDYDVEYVYGKLTVTEKEVNVEWLLTDVTYDGSAHTPIARFENIYGNKVELTVQLADTANGTLTNGSAINAGTYEATVTNANKNYKYSSSTKTYSFVIKLATVTVTKSGDSWYTDGLDFSDRNALITLDKLAADGSYEYIHIVGDQTAGIVINYSTAYLKGTEPADAINATYYGIKPQNIAAAGSYVVCYAITVANHETYYGKWSVDILDDTDPNAKFIQIIFTSPYVFEYGTLPETESELAALAEELFDSYIDTSLLRLDKQAFLANLRLVLRKDNDNEADNETGFGNYSIYFEWKEDSNYADWAIAYKADNAASDTNVGKLQIIKKQLSAEWSGTSFVADGTVHLPTLTISGFNDGSTYELELEAAESRTYTIEKDGRTLLLTVSISGDLTTAGAHVITLTLDNENFEIDGAVTAISVTSPTVLTVTWDNTGFVADGTTHLPTATVSDGTNTAQIAITAEMAANGGGTVEITLGGVTFTVNVTITGTGNLLTDAGKYTINLEIEDERYTLPAGSVTISVDAPAAAPKTEGLSGAIIGIIVAIAVLAFLLLIVIIVVIKRKPSTTTIFKGSDDGFDDYVDE